MEIRMPLKSYGNFDLIIRQGGVEKRETCQKLALTKLQSSAGGVGEGDTASHLITWYCFGCKRVFKGTLTENEADRVVFRVDDREFEFSQARRTRPGC